MNRISVIAFLILTSLWSHGQTMVVRYSNSKSFDKDVPKEKAKYSRTIITAEDGRETKWDTDLKKNEIYWREAYKGDEPMGVWIYRTGSGLAERDMEFELKYAEPNCANGGQARTVDDVFVDNAATGYKAPVIAGNEKMIYRFISSKMYYPAPARRNGIQGAVNLSFDITEEGNIENIVVNRGVHIELDKEAVRVFRLVKFASPPAVNGKPVPVCVKMPVSFKLG